MASGAAWPCQEAAVWRILRAAPGGPDGPAVPHGKRGGPTFLVELLKKSEYDLRTLIDGVEANDSSFMEYRVDANNPIQLIYQSGYLTIKGYDKRFGNYLLDRKSVV